MQKFENKFHQKIQEAKIYKISYQNQNDLPGHHRSMGDLSIKKGKPTMRYGIGVFDYAEHDGKVCFL